MAPRAYWKGYLKLSLVSCPIALFPATSEREKISFHQINKETGNRIKYRKVDADTGEEVEPENIIKGYEASKGEYFDDIADEKVPKDMLELAAHIIETKAGHFDPRKFQDQYEDALKDLIRKKQSGERIERVERREPAKVINLMDALRRSVEASGG